MDPAFLNGIANEAEVRPWLAGVGRLDFAATLSDVANYALVCDDGGFILNPSGPYEYEVHTIFRPGAGRKAVLAMRQAMTWMFTRTDCIAINSKVPISNKRAKGFAIIGGLRPVYKRRHEQLGLTEVVRLDMLDWAMNAAGMEVHGERFHNLLEQAKVASGSALPEHSYDIAHERAVGAALLMIEAGQPVKGVLFYNGWASVAGYASIHLMSSQPTVVDVRDAILGVGSNGIEVLLCR
jgi:hypothetical protein